MNPKTSAHRDRHSPHKKQKIILIKPKKQKKQNHNYFNNRFEQLIRICESISKKPIQLSKNNKPVSHKQSQLINLACTDETIQSVLKNRQKGTNSSRSFRLDLPEIKQKQYEQEDSFTRDRNLCLTQRITNIRSSQSKNTEMSTNIKTKSVKSNKYIRMQRQTKSKSNKSSKNNITNNEETHHKSITPFDVPFQKSFPPKMKVNIDVRKLLIHQNNIEHRRASRDKCKDKCQSRVPHRKIFSSVGSYNDQLGLF